MLYSHYRQAKNKEIPYSYCSLSRTAACPVRHVWCISNILDMLNQTQLYLMITRNFMATLFVNGSAGSIGSCYVLDRCARGIHSTLRSLRKHAVYTHLTAPIPFQKHPVTILFQLSRRNLWLSYTHH